MQDNVTGLIWEMKETNPEHPRYFGHTYSWWMASEQLNGGFAYHTSPGQCTQVEPCETQAYVDWVNRQGLCGYSDWRLPSIRELVSIAVISSEIPAFDKIILLIPSSRVFSLHKLTRLSHPEPGMSILVMAV